MSKIDKNKNSKKNIEQSVTNLIGETITNLGYELWSVEYYSEGGEWFLEISIDSIVKETGISLDDCETVTRAIDPIIDDADPIENSYSLLVSSPGLNRELKNDFHINKYIGRIVSVKLFAKNESVSLLKTDGKNFTGILKEKTDEAITFEIYEKSGKTRSIKNKQKTKKNNIIDTTTDNTDNKDNIDNIDKNVMLSRKDIAHIYAYDEIDI